MKDITIFNLYAMDKNTLKKISSKFKIRGRTKVKTEQELRLLCINHFKKIS